MIHTLARVHVEDLEAYVTAFSTRGAYMRGKHGSRGARVYHAIDEPGTAYVIVAWDDRAAFDAYLADPDARAVLEAGGVKSPPEFTVLEELGSYPR